MCLDHGHLACKVRMHAHQECSQRTWTLAM